jgi:hypothetical protein
MNIKEACRIAATNSSGEEWVVWEDYSENSQIRTSRYEDWLRIATVADDKIAIYENGEQIA